MSIFSTYNAYLNKIAFEDMVRHEYENDYLLNIAHEYEDMPQIEHEDFSDEEFDEDAPIIPYFLSNLAEAVQLRSIKQHFRNNIVPALIAEAMSPRRMMARISQFDDIEKFFECC